MAWHGPRGDCGCCGGCTCPGGGTGYPENSLTPHLRVVVSLPATLTETVVIVDAINGVIREDTVEITDLDGLNGTHFFSTTNSGDTPCLAYTAPSPGFVSQTLTYSVTRNSYNLFTCASIGSSTFTENVTLRLFSSTQSLSGFGNDSFGAVLRIITNNVYFTLGGSNTLACRTGFVQADETSNFPLCAPPNVSGGSCETIAGSPGNVYAKWRLADTTCGLSPTVTSTAFIVGSLNSTIVWL